MEDQKTTYDKMSESRKAAEARINIAARLGKDRFCDMGVCNSLATSISAIHHCRTIRNQFAHCLWHAYDARTLAFLEPEKALRTDFRFAKEDLKHVDMDLLLRQMVFFNSLSRQLMRLNRAVPSMPGEPLSELRSLPEFYLSIPDRKSAALHSRVGKGS